MYYFKERCNKMIFQSVRLSCANPVKLGSSKTSLGSSKPVFTRNVITLLGGGLFTMRCRLADIGPTSSSQINSENARLTQVSSHGYEFQEFVPVLRSSCAMPSAVSCIVLYTNRISFNSFLRFLIRNTILRVL